MDGREEQKKRSHLEAREVPARRALGVSIETRTDQAFTTHGNTHPPHQRGHVLAFKRPIKRYSITPKMTGGDTALLHFSLGSVIILAVLVVG